MRLLPTIRPLAGAQWPLLSVLALLVFVPAFLVTAVPRTLEDGYDHALREALAGVSADGPEIAMNTALTGRHPADGPATDEVLWQAGRTWTDIMPGPLRAVTGPVGYDVSTKGLPIGYPPGRAPFSDAQIVLGWDPRVREHVRYVSGEPPHNDAAATAGSPTLEVALAAKAAERLRLRLGDTVSLSGVDVRVSGLYEPVSAADPFWATRARLLAALDIEVGRDSLITMTTAILDAPGYAALYRGTEVDLRYSWRFPVVTGRVSAADAQALTAAIPELEFAMRNRQLGPLRLRLVTQLSAVLRDFGSQLRVTRTVLALAFAGLGAVAVGVLALGCRVLLERIRPAMATMRARGGSLAQLSGLATATVALVAVPAALAGYSLARLLAGGAPAAVALPGVPKDSVISADTYARVHGELAGAPLVGMIRENFGYTALAVGGYGSLTVLLALVIGASARGRTVSYLRTLGLSHGQARRLAVVELGPVLVVAAATGWVLGLVLPRVVGPAIDLRAYTGGLPAADYTFDLESTALPAGGLIVFAGLALAVDAVLNSRSHLGSAIRMGDQP